jgi:hypothetical protein
LSPTWSIGLAIFGVFAVSDLVYVVDHYLVHHDRARYALTHIRHHKRYGGAKDDVHLDRYERSTYGTAGVVSILITSVVTLMTGNVGYAIGAVLKLAHSLLFHLYQHGWWSDVPVSKQRQGAPRRTWGLATSHYHAYHHSHPDDPLFTYAESWAGFDRILERLHPVLMRYTKDGRLRSRVPDEGGRTAA